jgi:hypothetical protein
MSSLKILVTMTALCALTACATDAPEITVDPPTAEIQASKTLPVKWEYLGRGIIAHYYPQKAWDAQQDGVVYVSCAWNGRGHITACRVLREAPEGFGFGAATVEMLKAVGHVLPKDRTKDNVEAGEGLVVGIAWHARG